MTSDRFMLFLIIFQLPTVQARFKQYSGSEGWYSTDGKQGPLGEHLVEGCCIFLAFSFPMLFVSKIVVRGSDIHNFFRQLETEF